jgi:hypothetical protein
MPSSLTDRMILVKDEILYFKWVGHPILIIPLLEICPAVN